MGINFFLIVKILIRLNSKPLSGEKIHDYVRKLFSLVSWLPIGHLPVGPIQAIRSSSYACMMSDVIGRFQMAVVVDLWLLLPIRGEATYVVEMSGWV